MTYNVQHINLLLHRRLMELCMAVACMVMLHGCSAASDEPFDGSQAGGGSAVPGMLHTGFSITVSDTSGGTAFTSRAPGFLGDGYDSGAGYENYIDILNYNFKFYFFDGNNRLVAPMEVHAVVPTGQTATSKTYYVSGDTPADIKDAEVKVVALVNWSSYTDDSALEVGSTTIAQLCEMQYAFSADRMLPSETNLIPLFGIGKLQTLHFDDNYHAEVGTVHLLRAFAKVEVIKKADCPVDIEWARIYRYNNSGFCAPRDVNSESDYVHGSYDKDYVNVPNIPVGAEVAGEVPMVKTEGGSFIAYLPEYSNLTSAGVARPDGERAVIRVRFKEDTEKEYDVVEFKDYVGSGKHFDILRNYWYRFTLSKSLTPMVQMVPYNEIDLDPSFGLIVGPNYVPVLDVDGKIIYWYDPDTGQYYGPDKKTPVADPYISVDPVTGWSLVRDDNQRFFCYHDIKENNFYATDKETEIWNPFELVTTITIKDTTTKIECNEIRKKVTYGDKPTVQDKLFYYYDRKNSVWYRPDFTQLTGEDVPVYK